MRPTFQVQTDGQLFSAIRKKGEQHALRTGLRVELVQSYATEYGIVPAGARGVIASVADEDGTTWILMEGFPWPALYHWDNMLVISPHQTEDLVACLRLTIDKRLSIEHSSKQEA
jgi:hypothetical protein